MVMIFDFPLVLQHQVQTILTMQRQQFLRAKLDRRGLALGQRHHQTEKIQKIVAKTQGQIAQTFSEVPRVVQRLSRSP